MKDRRPPIKKDPTRDERITLEITVDANGPEEQAMGWYYYLQDKWHPYPHPLITGSAPTHYMYLTLVTK